jgi:hypothetical protein
LRPVGRRFAVHPLFKPSSYSSLCQVPQNPRVFLPCGFFLLKIPFYVTERVVLTTKSSVIRAAKSVLKSTDLQQHSIEPA